ncbi:hypothetical protein Kpol_1018p57 [Vanderwaltozyma polyspora DSM 70294]|uniref:COMPASS component SDC1 n=1 Tax=Vanderwaltozyma polyspora (strain ATCC 22028 / DSM 70294 / BCRC 21397 / CBS 2163 / NBRC 10782 / NRRL Y-8283 / UCD 57-17) TaxID=436907 RepID=A7TDQ5_VANPO|nr:uncharacterized protein Kpol_1018p57 [Vanderwaltozyma polyspora DSM 70294]EDO19525.1 hypothetical protein Kpol_1018p57 [Vanderwaltozyma polyspora DSM 70294]
MSDPVLPNSTTVGQNKSLPGDISNSITNSETEPVSIGLVTNQPAVEVAGGSTEIETETESSTDAMAVVGSSTNANEINLSETIGGSKTRKYLNQHITPYLLNGMRMIAVEKPADPLRALGEYLIKQSDQLNNANDQTKQ